MRIIPLDLDIEAGRKYLNDRSLQIGHVLPIGEDLFKEYFPTGRSFLVSAGRPVSGRTVDAMFCYRSGREKRAPIAYFTLVTDSVAGLKESLERIEDMAVAQEKLVVQTEVFGYDRKRLQALKAFGYKIGVSLPGAVSLDGKRFEQHYLYKTLESRYKFGIRRSFAKPGLYPLMDIEKAKNVRLRVRGYRRDDRPILDKVAVHLNVIRGIGSGVFDGLLPWPQGRFDEWLERRMVYPLVCEDESTGEAVGSIDLLRFHQDVMQHMMLLGMYVRADYQGLGVGTMLMDAAKTLAKRLHLSRVMLSVFEGNTPAEKLYRKAGFVECGKLPGWLQEGYVNEVYMMLQVD